MAGKTQTKKTTEPQAPQTPEEFAEALAKVETDADHFRALSALTDAEKAHYATLDEGMQKAFLDASQEARAAQVEKAQADDEVLEVNGKTIKKSDVGEEQFAVLKEVAGEAATARKEARIEKEKRELADFTKRAEDEYGHLPGETVKKGAVLKAIQILDEAVRRDLEAMLKAGEEACRLAELEKGTILDNERDGAEAELDKLAEEYREKHGVTKAAAYDAILQTKAGAELYNQSLAEQAEVA